MKIAAVLNAHGNTDLVLDTLESIRYWMTESILVVVDGAKWSKWGQHVTLPAHKVRGFYHNYPKAPYRNVAFGLQQAVNLFKDVDWLCYTEYDALFGSDRFKRNLEAADNMNVWMLGSDGHVDDKEMPLVEALIGERIQSCYYLIGCCQFFSRKFLEKLQELRFFERFLAITNDFGQGYMPAYEGYDISEHMYPSLARQFGGNIGVFATWDGQQKQWHGAHQYFPVRWQPDLDPETENFPDASIMHPLKDYNNPIRQHHREKRKCTL